MPIPLLAEESTEQFLSGGGEMGSLIRSMDWSKTALGPISSWPQSLRTSVSLCLSSTFPILIAWGPETIQIYNDSYRPICGAKHPQSMGENFRICWETALPVVGDKFSRGEQGEGTYITDQRMFLDRYGYLEETFMTFSFAPIRDESGGIGGIFHPITETTEKMLSVRRTQVLRDLGVSLGKAKSVQEIGNVTASQYNAYQLDLPFMLFYELKDDELQLINSSGLEAGTKITPLSFSLQDKMWPLAEVIAQEQCMVVTDLGERFGAFSCGPYDEAPHTAMILPMKVSGQTEVFGFIIAGVSVCRALDETYLNFYDQLAATYNTAISNVYAYEQEQKRAEALAEIDRSKTAFFSNVSHEFRTPLTLMLGPLEELLEDKKLDSHQRDQLEATHRNARRLLKLVNNLLDYSRVEAGRVQAVYQPLDLSELTTDLASSFRSIIEKAGMNLLVECPPSAIRYYADRQMWEKIVLNLLSNAFKYTLEGTITVSLEHQGNAAVLAVRDTGVGIPEKELPHMFQRFHRVENTAGRTHEGTGIGLSLVNELVQLQGGEITVSSVEGKGSCFVVKIPAGKSHLPAEQVNENTKETDNSAIKGAFIKEAYSLLQDEAGISPADVSISTGDMSLHADHTVDKATKILIVDDNQDMRNYLVRLLNPYFTIVTAVNGKEALKKISLYLPDLVLSDVMMPVMDGKAMLEEIRNDDENMRLPVIFLSARAGEEARIDGLNAGADDYLVKPFSAAELLTKVRAQVHISKTRGHAEAQLRQLLKQAPVAIAIYRGPNHVIQLANARMLDYWGRTELQTFGKPLGLAIPELEVQGYTAIMDTVYQSGKRFMMNEVPVMFNRFNKEETIYINLTVEPILELEGHIDGMIAVATDVTEQVVAKNTLLKTNNTLELAMEAARMGTWQSNLKTGTLELSHTTRQIHGITSQDTLVYGDTLHELVVPEDVERVGGIIAQAIADRGRFNMDYQIQPLDGSPRKWINSTGMVELDYTGEPSSVIGTILDITESKADELRKNDFIGMVSHELKTPLTSLVGFTQLGLRSAQRKQDTANAVIFERTNTQLLKMGKMINGFLNISQLESGKIQLNTTEFKLHELLSEIIDEVAVTAPMQIFNLEACEILLEADRDKIGTVLTNLLSNALKYGAAGKSVEVKCSEKADQVEISVQDHGIGIKASDINKLFDRYYRVENKATQNISGFGIGLYLSSEIIKRHQGIIRVESIIGEGTTFFITMPKRPKDF
jgi:signal transduction histidine kinase/CheY-like chemotaxis protein